MKCQKSCGYYYNRVDMSYKYVVKMKKKATKMEDTRKVQKMQFSFFHFFFPKWTSFPDQCQNKTTSAQYNCIRVGEDIPDPKTSTGSFSENRKKGRKKSGKAKQTETEKEKEKRRTKKNKEEQKIDKILLFSPSYNITSTDLSQYKSEKKLWVLIDPSTPDGFVEHHFFSHFLVDTNRLAWSEGFPNYI